MNHLEELKRLYESLDNKRSMLNMLRSEKYTHLVKFLDDRFPMLSNRKYSLGMKIYWALNGLTDFPKCSECGKPNLTHRCTIDGYATTVCSRRCANGEHKRESMRRTFLERYGVENPSQNDDVKKRRTETLVERYGVDNISRLDWAVEKIRDTKLRRYGDENFVNREKAKATNLLRYGVENPFESPEIQKKAAKTMMERYGSERAMLVPWIREMVAEANRRRQVHNSYENYLKTNPYSEPAFDEEFYLANSGKKREFTFICRKCGEKYTSRVHNGCIRRCPKCYPSVTTSAKEQELFDFLKSVYSGEILRKDRRLLGDGRELDIYIPDKKLAVEFDGLYWHSELNDVDRRYHLDKTLECEKAGVQLVHVFEDEWDVRQDIVKSRLANLLGIHAKTVFARKCDVVEIGSAEEADFLERNHIQGKVPSCACYGLRFNGELVALMSFSKLRRALGRRSEEGKYELLRFCPKLGHHVVGGAGRLLARFERDFRPKEIVSYADRRWSVGGLYRALGFSLLRASPPNYWYLANGCERREHRFRYRKNVLGEKLGKFDEKLSEYDNMRLNKYTRIWDCGNLVFLKTYPQENGSDV